MGLNAPGLTALQLQENALVLHYGGKTCTLPFRTGALVQSHLWDDPALPCVIAAGWRAPDSLLFRVHLLGERLGSLSLQLKLRPGGATLALCSHEEHPRPRFQRHCGRCNRSVNPSGPPAAMRSGRLALFLQARPLQSAAECVMLFCTKGELASSGLRVGCIALTRNLIWIMPT